jgi:hypothetical protein
MRHVGASLFSLTSTLFLISLLFVIDGWTKQVDETMLIHDLALLPRIL